MNSAEKKIAGVLQRMRCCIDRGNITFIDPDLRDERDKNKRFMQEYIISSRDRCAILKKLTTKDFSQESLDRQKTDPEFKRIMYVFAKRKTLEQRIDGVKKSVLIYIKIQFFSLVDGKDATLTISFHEADKDMPLMFM